MSSSQLSARKVCPTSHATPIKPTNRWSSRTVSKGSMRRATAALVTGVLAAAVFAVSPGIASAVPVDPFTNVSEYVSFTQGEYESFKVTTATGSKVELDAGQTLPPGMTLGRQANATLTLGGAPSAAGVYPVKFKALTGNGLHETRYQTYYFQVDAPDTFYTTHIGSSGTQMSWARLGGAYGAASFAGSVVSVGSLPDGSTQILGRGIDGNLYHQVRSASGQYSGFQPLPGVGGATRFNASSAAITGQYDGSAQVVAVGNDGIVYWNGRYATGAWTGWSRITNEGQNGTGTKVSIAGLPNGSTQVFMTSSHGTNYKVRKSDGSWGDFRVLNGPGPAVTALAAAAMPDGSTQLLAINGGQVYHEIFKLIGDTKIESGFQPLGVSASSVGITGIPVSSSSPFYNESQAVLTGSDGNVYHATRKGDGKWTAFTPLSGLTPNNPTFEGDQVAIAGKPDGSSQILTTLD